MALPEHGLQREQIRFHGAQCGQMGDAWFDEIPELAGVAEFDIGLGETAGQLRCPACHLGDGAAASLAALDELFRFQFEHGLPEGRSGDVHTGGEFAFGREFIARAQLTADDQALQVRRDLRAHTAGAAAQRWYRSGHRLNSKSVRMLAISRL